jgi:hypothetical protein
MTDLTAAASNAWSGFLGYGVVTDPSQLQAMSAEQMAEYVRRQGAPTNVPMSMRSLSGMQNAWRPPVRQPTMTLAEYDARRAAFVRPTL